MCVCVNAYVVCSIVHLLGILLYSMYFILIEYVGTVQYSVYSALKDD